MNFLDFITQDELNDLPEDPRMAFTRIVSYAQERLSERLVSLDPNDESQWHIVEDAYLGFMSLVVGSAKRFQIEPYASQQVPTVSDFRYQDYRQFRADLDHYLVQMIIDNSLRGRRETVQIPEKAKDRIRGHLNGLRDCLENATLNEAKRQALLDKLDAFEKELDRRRLSLASVTWVTLEILALPGAIWASADMVNKLVTNIMQTVGEAKVAEDESRRLAPVEPPKAITGPRPEVPVPTPRPRSGSSGYGGSSRDLDDEIPF